MSASVSGSRWLTELIRAKMGLLDGCWNWDQGHCFCSDSGKLNVLQLCESFYKEQKRPIEMIALIASAKGGKCEKKKLKKAQG